MWTIDKFIKEFATIIDTQTSFAVFDFRRFNTTNFVLINHDKFKNYQSGTESRLSLLDTLNSFNCIIKAYQLVIFLCFSFWTYELYKSEMFIEETFSIFIFNYLIIQSLSRCLNWCTRCITFEITFTSSTSLTKLKTDSFFLICNVNTHTVQSIELMKIQKPAE